MQENTYFLNAQFLFLFRGQSIRHIARRGRGNCPVIIYKGGRNAFRHPNNYAICRYCRKLFQFEKH